MDAPSVGYRTWVGLAALVIVTAGLWAAQVVVLPFLLAIMLAIIAAPGVLWLERRRFPSWLAVGGMMLLVMTLLAGIGTVLAASAAEFTTAVPRYKDRLDEMLRGLLGWVTDEMGFEVSAEQIYGGIKLSSVIDAVGTTLNGVLAALTNTTLVLLTVIFILLEVTELPRKVRAIADDPARALGRARQMIVEVQRYLVIKTVISAATGILLGIWTAMLGVDFPLLWGFSAFLLNYIPNIGSILAAAPPMLVALVQLGPGYMLLVGGGYVAVNFVLGNMVEPQWLGRKMGLSPLVVFVSLLFWGWLWGAVGMLLSVPLTMVIKILCEQSDGLRWISVALSSAPEVEQQRARRDGERVKVAADEAAKAASWAAEQLGAQASDGVPDEASQVRADQGP
ncbi:MAG: AI-2E family transporter [Nannocystis sp.]|nr:AI-2E family transporter [Nannocystis sp.]